MSWFKSIFSDERLASVSDILHPQLGRLVYEDEGWWKGKTEIGGQTIEFFINGNEAGINLGLDTICIDAIRRFSEYLVKAHAVLEDTLAEYSTNDSLEFYPFEICWFWTDGYKKGFTIRFKDSEEEKGRLWRVEFEDSMAKTVGYDD